MSDLAVWAVIVLTGVGTFAIRASFLSVAERSTSLPAGVERVLRMIPPAALSAIVALELGAADGSTALVPRLAAAGAAIGITLWRRSLALAVVVGMALILAFEAVT